ncbi:MAG: hypothetical protein GY729_08215 [Desulfobacteraceae bacterium]|nr:hypothetical protein [Desulfobacteraceae bacterium]
MTEFQMNERHTDEILIASKDHNIDTHTPQSTPTPSRPPHAITITLLGVPCIPHIFSTL